jgi:hypothetical protein
MGRAADLQKTQVCATHYMHNNPVKRGLVTQPGDWPWSPRGGEILLPYLPFIIFAQFPLPFLCPPARRTSWCTRLE